MPPGAVPAHRREQRADVVKLFVGQIPKTLEEDGVREVFHEFGEIVEVVILRDRRTNMHQGCCFVKYNSLIAAQSAINALHNQRSLPPLRNPLQVRFADSAVNSSDRGVTNAENKLFVGGVPTGCGDKELRQLFNTYGEVLDVYILASKASQVRSGPRNACPWRPCAAASWHTRRGCEGALGEGLGAKAGPLSAHGRDVARLAEEGRSQRLPVPGALPPLPPPPPPPFPGCLFRLSLSDRLPRLPCVLSL